VRDTLGEVPNVAVREFLSLIFAMLVDGRHNDRAGVYDTPLSLGPAFRPKALNI
jgi:hypothetical protein